MKIGNKNLLCLDGDPILADYPTYDFVLDEEGNKVIDHKTKLYKIDVRKNLERRALVMSRCEHDLAYRAAVLLMCKNNVLFYFNMFCWTYRLDLPAKESPYVPFTTFPMQDRIITWFIWCYVNGKTGIVEKTRGCGLSWIWDIFCDWMAKFHNGMALSMMSQNEVDVDSRGNPNSLFEKIRINLRLQPEWLRGGWEERSDNDRIGFIRFPDTGSVIKGGVAKGTAERGGRSSITGYDEFAFILEASEIMASSSELTNCAIIFSTPNGEDNEFARMANTPGVNKVSFHWNDHPLRNVHWEKMKRDDPRITEEIFAQEYEISYTKSNIGRIFPEFKAYAEFNEEAEWVNVADRENKYYDYDPNYDVYTCSDLGRDMTYFGYFQIKPSEPKWNPYTDKTVIFFDEDYWINGNIRQIRKEINEREFIFHTHISDMRTAGAADAVEMGWGEYLKEDEDEVFRMHNIKVGAPIKVTGDRWSEKLPIDTMKACIVTKGMLIFHPRCVLGIKAMTSWKYEIDKHDKDHEGRPKLKVKSNGQSIPDHKANSHPGKALIYGMQYLYGKKTKTKAKSTRITNWDFRHPTIRGI